MTLTASRPSPSLRSPVRVALIHPLRAWVDALEMILEPRHDIELVAAHTGLSWGRQAVVHGDVQVLLLHLGDGDESVEPMLRELFTARSDLAVVALSDSRDPALLASVVRAGVRGWVEPSASFDHLVRVLLGVSRGETWLPPDLMSSVLDGLVAVAQTRQRTAEAFASLTSRELDVLRSLAQGLSRHQIAEKYVLSPHTVRTHINHVLHKLDVHSTLAAVSLARRVGIDADAPPRRGQ